jgi:hypothetical protein
VSDALPAVDERLAPPETRVEYLNGVELFAAPADEPHGTKHSQIDRVMGSFVASGYTPAVDMLTRTGHASDLAPDFSIFPSDRDPQTHGRRIEEIAFEVTSEQALSVPTAKARQLIQRGVRRVFCLLVKQRRVLEWSRETDGWSPLADSAVIEDRCLVRPMPIAALLDATLTDDAIAQALLAKRPPSLERAFTETREAARKESATAHARRTILTIFSERKLYVPEGVRQAILACDDLETLDGWLRRAVTAPSAADVLGP